MWDFLYEKAAITHLSLHHPKLLEIAFDPSLAPQAVGSTFLVMSITYAISKLKRL